MLGQIPCSRLLECRGIDLHQLGGGTVSSEEPFLIGSDDEIADGATDWDDGSFFERCHF